MAERKPDAEMEETLLPMQRWSERATEGREVTVLANMFAMRLGERSVYHFDVSMEMAQGPNPIVRSNTARKVMDVVGSTWFGARKVVFAYDGRSNAYAVTDCGMRRGEEARTDVVEFAAGKGVKVMLRLVNELDCAALEEFIQGSYGELRMDILNVLNIALTAELSQRYTEVKRAFFRDDPQDTKPLGSGAVAWLGFTQAVKALQGGIMLSFVPTRTEMYKPVGLVELISDVLQRPLSSLDSEALFDRDVALLKKEFLSKPLNLKKRSGLRVSTTHRESKRPYEIIDITSDRAEDIHFLSDGNREETVSSYFERMYGPLRFPHLPCVNVGNRATKERNGRPGRPARDIFLPLEVCKILPGQRRDKHPTDAMAAARLKLETIHPEQRLALIRKLFTEAAYGSNECASAFKLELSSNPLEVKGRVLDAPAVRYNRKSADPQIKPADGVWNMQGHMMYQGGQKLERWGVLVLQGAVGEREVGNFVEGLIQVCNENGLETSRALPPLRFCNYNDLDENFNNLAAQVAGESGQCQLILIVKPDLAADPYRLIKQLGDSKLGFATQVVQAKHVMKNQMQYRSNVALKLNAKLGGKNSVLADREALGPLARDGRFMVIGLAVSHGKAGVRRGGTSMTAVSGSLDPQLGQFAHEMAKQTRDTASQNSSIMALTGMVAGLLTTFKDTWTVLPENLLFYREGLTEGMYTKRDPLADGRPSTNVFDVEMKMILQACEDVQPGYRPNIAYCAVTKLHKMRFFGKDRDSLDRSGNCKAGVIVDTKVVSPRFADFYLFSHAGLQGTSRPAKYTLLHDEIGFTPQEFYKACFWQCFTFARCPRSVSIVPAIYYAELLAQRAMLLANLGFDDISDGMTSVTSGEPNAEAASSRPQDVALEKLVHSNHRRRLFCM
uniref:Piwi domain-containing protein n=1 Tax=Erythrolobus australicus TaxID=1077150 RepID=A0A7S1XHP8_9RHOD